MDSSISASPMEVGEARAEAGSADNSQEIENASITQMSETTPEVEPNGMTRPQAFNLYTSHFLSTWNVRTYEFAAIIFTAAAYPDTLVAPSVRGIVRTVASICFSSAVGRTVDQNPDRLKSLLSTISVNRFAVIGASVLWFFIVDTGNGQGATAGPSFNGTPISLIMKGTMFTLILLLGILENLSASGNMLSMERDWVVTAAASDGRPYDLTHLNSMMRRIDLICKLVAPILISVIISATSTKIGVLAVAGMSTSSWAVEVLCARRAWNQNPKLKAQKFVELIGEAHVQDIYLRSFSFRVFEVLRRSFQDFKHYFSSSAWIPSLALALLHISALAYSATFITFLLSVGFSLDLITAARAAGSIVEISSTVVTPLGIQYLGKPRHENRIRGQIRSSEGSEMALLENESLDLEGRTETGLERLGLWGICWQLINLVPVVLALWSLSPGTSSDLFAHLVSRILGPVSSQPLLAFILFFFLSISRLGLWIYDLTTQQLTQTMVRPSQRSSFTGVEYSFVSAFELGQYIVAIILHRPDQFKWIALMSWSAVAISTVVYAGWVWKMRGHLVHWEMLGKSCECIKIRHDS